MECGRLKAVSRFLKCTRSLSPTRALISGPGIRSELPEPAGTLATDRFQSRVLRRYTVVPNTLSAGAYSIPMIASRPLGTILKVTGTAATQYSRVAADADGAASRLAAPMVKTVVSRLTGR